jgi:hypothetical protein
LPLICSATRPARWSPFQWRPLLGLILALVGTPPCAAQQETQKQAPPDGLNLLIESFAPARPYAIGASPITLVGTIRNKGGERSSENGVSARLYCLSGLEYLQGDTIPQVPPLEPDGATTFKWQVVPTGTEQPLVASLALDRPGAQPEVRVITIQRLAEPPPANNANPIQGTSARTERNGALLENAKLRLHVRFSEANVPFLFVSCRMAGGWRRVGTSVPLAEVLSAEGGQIPWWEVFKSEDVRAVNGTGESSLIISGGFGIRWRATFALTLHKDSAVVDTRLSLSPLRPMRLSAIRYCPLMAGEGSFGAATSAVLAPTGRGPNTTTAVRWGAVTVGTIWPTAGPLAGWTTAPATPVEGVEYRLLGVEARAGDAPTELAAGAVVSLRGRLYALSPSASVSDAFRVTLPAESRAK